MGGNSTNWKRELDIFKNISEGLIEILPGNEDRKCVSLCHKLLRFVFPRQLRCTAEKSVTSYAISIGNTADTLFHARSYLYENRVLCVVHVELINSRPSITVLEVEIGLLSLRNLLSSLHALFS